MLDRVKRLFSAERRRADLQAQLDKLKTSIPVPVFWLFGKTQSGKTSLIRTLTGATDAEIGQGFRPCTRFSREYQFPTAEAPLLTFLDTRGLDEPGYDPAEDLARFNSQAHVVVVVVKALDHAQENVLKHLSALRRAAPDRPVVLILTCLHEAYPQQQHPLPYPYATPQEEAVVPEDLRRSLAEQRRRFGDLVDHVVPVDLTPAEEGFNVADYGGDAIKAVLLRVLPAAYRQTFLTVEAASRSLQDLYARHAVPYISFYSLLAGAAGAIPIPWVDLLILPGIQTRMIHDVARLYGQPFQGKHFAELAGALGVGMAVRQGVRELAKFIPYVGSVAGGALAGASTFALGKAACFYYSAVQKGHAPPPEELRRYYREQFALVERSWAKTRGGESSRTAP